MLYEIANQVQYFLMLSLDYSFLNEPRCSQMWSEHEVNHIRTGRWLQMMELSLQVCNSYAKQKKETKMKEKNILSLLYLYILLCHVAIASLISSLYP